MDHHITASFSKIDMDPELASASVEPQASPFATHQNSFVLPKPPQYGQRESGKNSSNEEGKINAFLSPAANARFLADFGWLIEAHHRYGLYDPSSRRSARQIIAAFEKCVSPSAVPAIANMMNTIIQDIDDQEGFEKQQYEEDDAFVQHLCHQIR